MSSPWAGGHRGLLDQFVATARGEAARARAQRLLHEHVIAHPSLPDVALANGDCWRATLPRTHGRYLHGFLFLGDWHETVLAEGEPDIAHAIASAADLFLAWQRQAHRDPQPPMAYHDETTAQRLMQLVRLLDDHGSRLDADRRDQLADLASRTADLLLSNDFHAGSNNHGMFQDLALLRYAAAGDWRRLEPTSEACIQVAVPRLGAYFSSAFTADGVHVENSPGYHLMVARFLRDVLPALRAMAPSLAERLTPVLEGAERYAVHCILPDGRLAPLGDTKADRVRDTSHRTTFPGDQFRFAVSQGVEGQEPSERTAVFPDAGYAIHRTSWTDPLAYVVTLKAAYLSAYHHHGDDLALTVWGAGRWLLSEAGPFGYDYSDPLTKYAFSQFAHNTVIIDGRSLPRADKTAAGVSLRDLHDDADATAEDTVLDVVGTNSRFRTAVHQREVHVREPEAHLEVTVTDTVTHDDGDDHDYEVLWHLGKGVRPFLRSHGVELYVGQTKVLELTWHAPSAVRASIVTPTTQGPVRAVRFPVLGKRESGLVIRVATSGPRLDLTTTIRTGGWFYRDWGIATPGSAWQTFADEVPVNYLLETTPGAHRLVIAFSAMAPDGSFTYNYKRLLDTLPAHRLYILDDFGTGGAYYWSDHRDTLIRDAVQRHISQVLRRLGLGPEDVAMVGSSKGGTAALLHGIRLGAARVVVGAPQVHIGAFVSRNRPNIEEFMAGGTTDADAEWLDDIVPAVARTVHADTHIDLVIGTADHHYTRHLPHLVAAIDAANHPHFRVIERPGLKHADIGPPFREYAREVLTEWLGTGPGRSGDATISLSGKKIHVATPAGSESDLVACTLFLNGAAIERGPSRRGVTDYTFDEQGPGDYRARVFIRSSPNDAPRILTTPTLRVAVSGRARVLSRPQESRESASGAVV